MENKLSNRQLIKALNAGDAFAFKYLYKEWFQILCFFAMKMTGSKEDAEDIVANTLTQFYRANNKFEHVYNLEAFLYTSVRNACINHIKKLQSQSNNAKEYSYLADYQDEDTIENIKIKAELLNEIIAEVKKLPAAYRQVFELSIMQGVKNEEIARRLNISLTNVTTRKNRAINLLRLRLSEEGLFVLYILVLRSIH
jgi:RNA polymerase sigma-70 factor (ECF subfamily)